MGDRPKARSLRQRVYCAPCVGALRQHLTDDRPGKFPATVVSRSGTRCLLGAFFGSVPDSKTLLRILFRSPWGEMAVDVDAREATHECPPRKRKHTDIVD